MTTAIESFLAKKLGGRHQESMAPEVAEKLEEITVDPSTVKAPERAPEVSTSEAQG
jgi:hypothetical protein